VLTEHLRTGNIVKELKFGQHIHEGNDNRSRLERDSVSTKISDENGITVAMISIHVLKKKGGIMNQAKLLHRNHILLQE